MKRIERGERERGRGLLEEHGEAAEEPQQERRPPGAVHPSPAFLIRRNLFPLLFLLGPPPRDQRPCDEERREVGDGAVAVEEEVVEGERAVRAVEDARGDGAPRGRAPVAEQPLRRQPARARADATHARSSCRIRAGRNGRPEDDPHEREPVRVERSRVVRVLLIPALPRFGRAVAFLPVEVRPVRGNVGPVPGRETGRPLDVRVLVRLHPEVPRRERRRDERRERCSAQREDEREHGDGRRDARADGAGEHTGILGA